MPNLLDIRRRIKSVKNTQQITKAMKMVSAAKLKRAQDRVVTARPFANKMMEVLGELAKRTDEDFHHPLLDLRGDERYLMVLVTADKGLCGAFNTNLVKAAQTFVKNNEGKTIELFAIGRKGRDFFRNRNAVIVEEYVALTGKGRVDFSEALEVAQSIIKLYTEDEGIDKVFLIYNEFKSVLQQRVVLDDAHVTRLLGDEDAAVGKDGQRRRMIHRMRHLCLDEPRRQRGRVGVERERAWRLGDPVGLSSNRQRRRPQ